MIDLTQFWKDNPDYARNPRKEYGIYVITYQPLAPNALQQDGNFVTGQDADFIVTSMYGSQTTAASQAAYIITPLVLNMVYTGKNRNITSIKVEWTTVIGTAANPRIYWPYPIVIPKATQFDVFVDNPQGVGSTVNLSFHGIKVFF